MAGRLKKIIDKVMAQVSLKSLAVARLNMKLGIDVAKVTETTPDDPELEKKLILAAKEVLGISDFNI